VVGHEVDCSRWRFRVEAKNEHSCIYDYPVRFHCVNRELLPFMVHVGSFVILTQLAKPIANMPSGVVAEGDKRQLSDKITDLYNYLWFRFFIISYFNSAQ